MRNLSTVRLRRWLSQLDSMMMFWQETSGVAN